MTPQPSEQPHPVWAGGPPCSPQCPGDWSDFHYGYSAGFEAAAPDPVASPPADGFVVVGTCHTHQVYDCWECRPKRWVASPAPLDVERLLLELASGGVEIEIPHKYVSVQHDTTTWADVQAWAKSNRARLTGSPDPKP